MNKTNPIGVRFRLDLLEKLKTENIADTPQRALVFYERFYVTWSELGKNIKSPLRDNEATAVMQKERDTPNDASKNATAPLSPNECVPEIDRDAIVAQIKAIKAEKCPEHRNTPIGKKSWQIEQNKRIQELQNKLL